MAERNLLLMWEKFVDAAEHGTKNGGSHKYKQNFCRVALKLSDELINQGFITELRYEEWKMLFRRINYVLESDGDVLRRIVKEYFLCLHHGELSNFSIEFADKEHGQSIGTVCTVKFSGHFRRVYIKCHQQGPKSSASLLSSKFTSVNKPIVLEMFIYKILENLGVGGVVHFPLPISTLTKKAFYIGTEEINFTLATHLNKTNAKPSTMFLIFYLQTIFCLKDVGTNVGNFGQGPDGNPVIVDFWIAQKDSYILSQNNVEDFWSSNTACNSRLIADMIKELSRKEKEGIIEKARQQWDILAKIDESKNFVDHFLAQNEEKLEVSGDLERYIQNIKSNILMLGS